MIRTIMMGVCALSLGLVSACDQGAEAQQKATEYAAGRHAYYDAFATNFFSANGKLMVQ